MKTLINIIHPDIKNSIINARWIEELKKYTEKYTVRQLHEIYPDRKIDVLAEQKLIEQYDKIVFQFPFYWFSCPPFFKQWLDEVFTYGWAYGSRSGYRVSGKKIALAMSVGIDEHEYSSTGKYLYTVAELTRSFELTFKYVKADYRPFFAYYGIELNSKEEWIENSVPLYMAFLENLSDKFPNIKLQSQGRL